MSEAPNTEVVPNSLHATHQLRESVERALETSGSVVRDRVKDHLVEEKLKERVKLVLDGVTKRDELQRTVYRIKPDVLAYDAEGKVVSSNYSKSKVDELKKATEQLSKLDKALAEALAEKPNFESLKKALGGGGGSDKQNDKTE